MGNNYIHETAIQDVLIIERPLYEDNRGFFQETFRKAELENKLGREIQLDAQANHSYSFKKVLRGIHIAPWCKLVTCLSGMVQQVVVDCRPYSNTFGKHVSTLIGNDNWRTVFIPEGCGNAFLTLSLEAHFFYQISAEYGSVAEQTVAWNDRKLNIPWMEKWPLLSDKDKRNPTFQEVFHGASV